MALIKDLYDNWLGWPLGVGLFIALTIQNVVLGMYGIAIITYILLWSITLMHEVTDRMIAKSHDI